ncbi:MAG: class I SAM-dependent methyltransferase [Moorea sp. SIO1F2]|uniref:class I SAM-dependent methyltransferase n=1 Tax=Moorena sp. SIO1F2 TaxID=2607819 RepID=UPI0013BBC3DA|nr:class I SAM-dependent methyltransferase [Moorena sp. SIO1F2]NET81404.1 class I SAM-dependent methyltransferase [Moorena sp. SIO1F2]
MPTDLYQGMSDFYNAFVQRNRDYKAIATELIDLFGDQQDILDVGIGTGLLVEQIIQLRPELQITGVDTSASLLEQAQQCLGTQVDLHCQDVVDLHLDKMFDLAYSRGGAWAFVNDGNTILLASHILDLDAIQQSFERVAAHLRDEGRLIIISSNANHGKREELDGEVTFERTVSKDGIEGEQYLILDYRCHRNGGLVGHQRVRMRLLDLDRVEEMLVAVGLGSISDHHNKYHIYQKKGSE